jgi:GNAT superfamily N-acetyltransferase
MNPFHLRPAQPADTDAVLALNHAIYGADDYLPGDWQEWLADDASVTVAILDGAVVGLIHCVMLTADEAWLEGVRVAPAAQGRGIATALVQHAIQQARSHHAAVIRASTEETNAAMRSVLHGSGFVQVGSYVHFVAPTAGATPDPTAEALIHRPASDDLDRLWAWLERSNIAPLAGGCYMEGRRALALTDDALTRFLAAGQVWTLEDYGEIQALAIGGPRRRGDATRFSIRYLDGAMQGIGQLALHLRAQAAEAGHARIDAHPPDLLILRDAMEGAGFSSEGRMPQWIYAKDLA